jgi:hypothetical protein
MVDLPNYKKIVLRNQVDRFGFSNLLSDILSFSYTPRSFCSWLHGWVWWDSPSAYTLGCNVLPFNTPVVVAKNEQKHVLNSVGYLHVYVDGLPFSYTTYTGTPRKQNSLLSFLPHSDASHPIHLATINDYLDYLLTIENSFTELFVCVFWEDFFNKELVGSIVSRGLKYIVGAKPDDANALIRMRTILDYFDFVTTPTMGSHIVYAAYAGCKISICGPFISTRGNDTKTEYQTQEEFDRCVEVESLEWLRNNFLFLFFDHPKDAISQLSWAKKEIANNKLTNHELIDILGWSVNGQIKGYFRGFKNRIVRGS